MAEIDNSLSGNTSVSNSNTNTTTSISDTSTNSHSTAPVSVTATNNQPTLNVITGKQSLNSKKLGKKLVSWFTFSIIIALLPIILNIISAIFINNKPLEFYTLFAHGELLLISVGIAADAIGDLLSSGKIDGFLSFSSMCICFLILLVSAISFASLGIGGAASNVPKFGMLSLYLFFFTLAISCCCKILSEV